MRKLIAMLLLAATLLGLVSGCANTENGAITMGQWLSMINQEFGMSSYVQEEPYFSNIGVNDPYFGVVQAAADWNVVDPEKPLDVYGKVTWKDALITLVNAGAFLDEEATEDEKIAYAIENFDPSIRTYWMNRTIKGAKATALLVTAQNKWANKTYDKNIEEVEYADDVLDLTQGEDAMTNYTISEEGVVAIPVSENVSIEAGQIYSLPANNENDYMSTFRAEEVTTDGEFIYIKNSEEEPSLEEVVENLDIESTLTPDIEDVIIYDANGEMITNGAEVVSQHLTEGGTASVVPLNYTGGNATVTKLVNGKVTHDVTIGDIKLSLEYQLDGKLDLKASFESPNLLSAKYQKLHPTQSLNFQASTEISNVSVTQDVKIKWFKLKSASVRLNYETKTEFGVEFSGKPVDKLIAPKDQNLTAKDWKSTFVKNWASKVWKDSDGDNAKGAKTIKIASITVKNGGIYRVCLDINYVITAKGSVSVVITEHGCKGVEYKDKKLRTIKTSDKDVDIEVKGTIESYTSVGPTLYTVGLKKPVIGLALKVGFGAEVGLTFHVADTEGHLIQEIPAKQMQSELAEVFEAAEIDIPADVVVETAESQGCTFEQETSDALKGHLDVCFDGSVYFILRIGIDDSCVLSDFISIDTNIEICGKKNAKLLHLHADNGDWQFGWIGKDNVECQLEYKPFDPKEETTEPTDTTDTTNGGEDVEMTNNIVLNELYTSVEVGSTVKIQVTGLPKGYTMDDLIWSVDSDKVAKVDANGVVTGLEEGATVVIVTTKDGKCFGYCAVTVLKEDASGGGGGGGRF